jgi:hypothetical protein
MADDLTTPYDDDPEKRDIYLQGAAAAKERKPLTIDDVRNMSVAEVMARKSEVHEAIRRGKVSGEGSDDDAAT